MEPTEHQPQASAHSGRRHDLDALRGFAMLLGILLHAAMAYIGIPWPGRDERQLGDLGLLVPLIHGFRMPMFFLISGFFTAMLFQRRGLGGLIRHRFKRIAIPLAIGCVTIIPAVWGALIVSDEFQPEPAAQAETVALKENIWLASRAGDLASIDHYLQAGIGPDTLDPIQGDPPIAWALFGNQPRAVEHLLEHGADPNTRYRSLYTPLHTAAFLGRSEAAAMLLEAGADVNAEHPTGERPIDSLLANKQVTEFVCKLLQIDEDFDDIRQGREAIGELFLQADAESTRVPQHRAVKLVRWVLFEFPAFHHLWFLWFLTWMVAGFSIVVPMLGLLSARGVPIALPSWLVASPLCLFVLVPLTFVFQSWMHPIGAGSVNLGFGPETSIALIPMPSVLGYYAVFFGFGAALFTVPGAIDRVSRLWPVMLVAAAVVGVPGLVISMQMPLGQDWFEGVEQRQLVSNICQVLYAWLMTFGLIGLFRSVLSESRPWVRYLSDASYWLYMAHLPIIMLAQTALSYWDAPALLKVVILTVGTTAILLAVYQLGVRHTIIGKTLNGKRPAPGKEPAFVPGSPPNR